MDFIIERMNKLHENKYPDQAGLFCEPVSAFRVSIA